LLFMTWFLMERFPSWVPSVPTSGAADCFSSSDNPSFGVCRYLVLHLISTRLHVLVQHLFFNQKPCSCVCLNARVVSDVDVIVVKYNQRITLNNIGTSVLVK